MFVTFFANCAWNPQEAFREELRRVEALRGIRFAWEPELVVMNRSEWHARLAEWESGSPPSETDVALDALWKALGIVPEEDDSRRVMFGQMRLNQGYVEPGGKRVYYFTDTPSRARRRALFHAILHCLQYQRSALYDLGGDHAEGYLDDVAWARVAAAEGEAVLYELAWPEDLPAGLAEKVDRLPAELSRGATRPYAVRWAYFSYIAGARYLLFRAKAERRLREAADALHADPPMSTEQVLHPERADDPPIAVIAPDLASRLGERWRMQARTVLGEWTLADWVRALRPDAAPEAFSADHIGGGLPDSLRWGGDVAHVYGHDQGAGRALIVWTVWDDEASAERFECLVAGAGVTVRRGRSVAVGIGPVPEAALEEGLAEIRSFQFRTPEEFRRHR